MCLKKGLVSVLIETELRVITPKKRIKIPGRAKQKGVWTVIYLLIDHEVHHQVHPSLFQFGD